MTNKEAIFELIKYRRRLEKDSTIDAEAYDMAIEALQAHPTLDDVSNSYENGYQQGKFEALQSQQKTGKWIPCSERKPKQQQPVIITDEGDVLTGYINSLNEWKDFHGNRLKGVIAWMPLPEPYKESEG